MLIKKKGRGDSREGGGGKEDMLERGKCWARDKGYGYSVHDREPSPRRPSGGRVN